MHTISAFIARLHPRGTDRVAHALAGLEQAEAELARAVDEIDDEILQRKALIDAAQNAFYTLRGEQNAAIAAADSEAYRAQKVLQNLSTLLRGVA